jgi:hypothetical protein
MKMNTDFWKNIMNKKIRYLIASAMLMGSLNASAYETSTHERLIQVAANRSVLFNNPAVLADLGLRPVTQPDGYLTSTSKPVDAMQLLRFGGVWEDDGYNYRAFNHFFNVQNSRKTDITGLSDPQLRFFSPNNLPLKFLPPPANNIEGTPIPLEAIFGIPQVGWPAPDWILEDRGNKAPIQPFEGNCATYGRPIDCAQEFSFKKGQQYLFSALTAQYPYYRSLSASHSLQSVGHVLHMVQDMASPQHVRNDQHTHPLPGTKFNPPWSFYEVYTETQNNDIEYKLRTFAYPEYAIPVFGTAREFFYTPDPQTTAFKGIADFASRNFTTYLTQYIAVAAPSPYPVGSAKDLPMPNGTGTAVEKVVVPAGRNSVGGEIPAGTADYLTGYIRDEYSGQPTEKTILAASSMLNSFVPQQYRIYTENTITYHAGYKFLMPRAVGYSAGMINHFFRGRLNLENIKDPDDNGPGNTWKVTNIGTQPMDGEFTFYREQNGTGERTLAFRMFAAVPVGGSTYASFSPYADTGKMIVAFRGRIGNEGDATLSQGDDSFYATAGKVVDFTPPIQIISVNRPTDLVAGQPFTVSWSTTGANLVDYVCNYGGKRYRLAGSGSFTDTAKPEWASVTDTCTLRAYNDGPTVGAKTHTQLNIKTTIPVPSKEIIIVGTAFKSSDPIRTARGFWWSDKTGLILLALPQGAFASNAWGVSPDGAYIAGNATGILLYDGIANPFSTDFSLIYAQNVYLRDVPVRWRLGSPTYLNGNSTNYGQAWTVDNNGIAKGESALQTGAVVGAYWDQSGGHASATTFGKNARVSSDGTIVLGSAGTRAAYTKGGNTIVLPLPAGYDSMNAWHVVIH